VGAVEEEKCLKTRERGVIFEAAGTMFTHSPNATESEVSKVRWRVLELAGDDYHSKCI